MGKNSRKRRDDRRRAHPRQSRHAHDPSTTSGVADLIDLIGLATRYAVQAPRAAAPRIEVLNEIGAAARPTDPDPAAMVVDRVLMRIARAWEHGWQPQDLVHAARRRTSSSAARWMTRAVLVESDQSGASGRAPDDWVVQLRVLSLRHDASIRRGDLLHDGGRASVPTWIDALVCLHFLDELPASERLVPPPSEWGKKQLRPRPAGPTSDAHAKTLTRIRALLAKAESTEFAAEAEAFTAKAQDLMTRHAIDEVLLADEAGESFSIGGSRVLIDHPYALEKARLLDIVAKANRTRAVWHDFAAYMTLVGAPTDLAQVEMLFTSTLVQATRAMTQAGQEARPSAGERSSTFRKSFLTAYAVRIGERLATATDQAAATYGSDLVPVFERQAAAIEEEFERLFPHVTTGSRQVHYDRHGWDAGTRAADDAVLPAGMVES